LLTPLFRIYKSQPLINLTFNAYLKVAPPDFAAGSADDQDGPLEPQRISDQPGLEPMGNGAARTAAEKSVP
jgi:hypothetical protein